MQMFVNIKCSNHVTSSLEAPRTSRDSVPDSTKDSKGQTIENVFERSCLSSDCSRGCSSGGGGSEAFVVCVCISFM